MSDLKQLCQKLDYRFNDESLLALALTHRSLGSKNNERLEFLGDSILGMVIATELFSRFPKEKEGILTRLRSSLVKGETLTAIANELGLSEYITLGSGELKSGGFRRASTLADAVEAIIGAIYLDSSATAGIDEAKKFILGIYKQRLEQCNPADTLKDPKTRLQEYLQAKGQPLPDYEVVDISGKEHQQTFRVACVVEGLGQEFIAKGSSRRKAEQAVASKVLKTLTNE